MIAIDEDTPRWIRELSRYVHVKNLLFLHGNVLDLVSYPMPGAQGKHWVDGDDLRGFLRRFLTSSGYTVVGEFDPVDGLTFAEPGMRAKFDELASAGGEGAATSDGSRSTSGSAAASSRPPANRSSAHSALARMAPVLANATHPSAFVFNLASRLVSSPEHLSSSELELFTRMLKASQEAREVIGPDARWRNLLILVCGKLNDLPAFLYLNNPRARAINVDLPDRRERGRFCRAMYPAFHHSGTGTPQPGSDLVAQFSALTEGLTYFELNTLVGLSRQEGIPLEPVEPLIERYKYGVTQNEWDLLDPQRLGKAEEFIGRRIKGQPAAVARMLDSIKRAILGLAAGSGARNQRPRATLFFAGPTGVGKTELAKAIAALLFGSEDRLLRFDMSEYSAEHAAERLLGAPPGYLGYEAGGQLTNRIKENPFSVVLFDEIEKAHPRIFDKFLQLLDDGRLTSGQGETVYFSECIIIFTSNLGTVTARSDAEGGQPVLVNEGMPYPELREVILQAIRDHFNLTLGRPEILNRFGDNFVVFDFIRPPVDQEIVGLLLDNLLHALEMERHIRLEVATSARQQLGALAGQRLAHGGRGIRNLMDSALVEPLARWLFDNAIRSDATLRLRRIIDRGPEAPYRFELDVERVSA
jgi:hypothetical protein